MRPQPECLAAMSPKPFEASVAGETAVAERQLSEILRDLAEDPARERVSIADLLAAMQDRALGALLFIFAVPNVVPVPPGTSAILGAPLIFLAAQLTLGMRPWLPQLIAQRSMARKDFAAIIGKVVPWLQRAERLLRPRLRVLSTPVAERVVGIVCFLLSVVLFLPIPLGNMLPALSISILALGLLERDGVWVLAGLATSVLSAGLVWGVIYGLIKAGLLLISTLF
jgi:hypothetical protein